MTGRARLGWALVAAAVALGCTKLLPNRCDVPSDCGPNLTCDMQMKTCIANGGAGGAAGTAGAGGAAGAAGAKGGAGGAMGGAAGEKFTCLNAKCISPTPICDVDAGACLGCDQVPGSCQSAGGGTPVCVSRDAGAKAGTCVECLANSDCKGATPICELAGTAKNPADTCRACGGDNECKQINTMTPVCVPGTDAAAGPQPGICVGCLTDANCTSANSASTTPVCEPKTNACRACTKDSECEVPGVCMVDGHCASASEVIFVDSSATCNIGTGTATNPYCSLATATPHLGPTSPVMVILGGTNDQLTLATSSVTPVILGRKNAGGDIGSIPANAATAITVSAGTVLIRDLTVNLGSGSASKGIAVTGTGTSLSLRRVTVSLGTKGLGIDAESGTTLTMDQCYVENNPAGGIVVNGATANIQNTLIAGTLTGTASAGTGIQFSSPGSGTLFRSNTVVAYPIAATAGSGDNVVLTGSIVLGPVQNCDTSTSVTSATNPAPSFSASNPYHLTGHEPCPMTPTSFPDHDIDGDPRTSTNLDCGADQLVP